MPISLLYMQIKFLVLFMYSINIIHKYQEELTIGTFEFDGEKYKKASRHQKEWGNTLIANLNLTGNESILDLGCGDGVLTEKLSLLVPDSYVLGIDVSQRMTETAKKYEHNNLSFKHMDINLMDFDKVFDVIFSNAALH